MKLICEHITYSPDEYINHIKYDVKPYQEW